MTKRPLYELVEELLVSFHHNVPAYLELSEWVELEDLAMELREADVESIASFRDKRFLEERVWLGDERRSKSPRKKPRQ